MTGRFRTALGWPLLLAAALVLAVLAPSCSSSDKRDRGSEETEALVANMLDLAARIPDIASEMSARGDRALSAAERADLERLGVLAWKIRDRATAPAAFDAAAKIERVGVDAVLKGGGQVEPNGSTLTLGGAPIATTTWDARAIQDGWRSNGGPDGRLEGGDLIGSVLEFAINRLTKLSILSAPATRAAFVPNLGPETLPAALPTNSEGRIDFRLSDFPDVRGWGQVLYDDSGRLLVPYPTEVEHWQAFSAWMEYVNPMFEKVVDRFLRSFERGALTEAGVEGVPLPPED